jgi:hypothetical protein
VRKDHRPPAVSNTHSTTRLRVRSATKYRGGWNPCAMDDGVSKRAPLAGMPSKVYVVDPVYRKSGVSFLRGYVLVSMLWIILNPCQKKTRTSSAPTVLASKRASKMPPT